MKDMTELRLRANAKINLFLEVMDKRPDGYHNIETVFQSIALHDVITLRENASGIVEINCDHPQVPLDSSNLAYRAAELLSRESGKHHGVQIHILKRIPVGAGLAGGSADAAATLVGLNDLWGMGYDTEGLAELGTELGADVPFCTLGGTALGRGRGDELTQLTPFSGIPVVIANPGFQISTAWAYGSLEHLGLTRARKSANILIGKMQRRDVPGVGNEVFNIFESVVIGKYPLVHEIKEQFIRSGALGALMTGSGPTVFALARDMSSARRMLEQASHIADFCIIAKTSDASIVRM
jgi:4-diphosphocytidyl-2-C-methyl-D-erythritol kinase